MSACIFTFQCIIKQCHNCISGFIFKKCYEQAKIKEETAFGEVTIVPDHRKRIGNDLVFCQACCTGDRCNVLYPDCPAMLKGE